MGGGKYQLSCSCCPYGYHIDLDFVRFCEALSLNSGRRNEDADDISKQRRNQRRQRRERRLQRQSMEVLLGIAPLQVEKTEPITEEPLSRTIASIQVGDALQKAVVDFEETLERSSRPSAFTSYPYSPILPSDLELIEEHNDGTAGFLAACEMLQQQDDVASATAGAQALQNIREQMAVSLAKMKDLEEQVKLIPVLQVQLSVLKEEKRQMLLHLKNEESTKLKEKNIKPDGLIVRDVGVMCGAVMRDIGISHSLPKLRSFGTQMSTVFLPNGVHYSEQSEIKKQETKENTTSTELRMNQVYSENELDQNIAKAIKLYEETFRHHLTPKKKDTVNLKSTGSQANLNNEPVLKIIEKKDSGTQVSPSKGCKEVGLLAKPRTNDVGICSVVKVRHFGCSDNRIDQAVCEKCSIKRHSIGVGTSPYDFIPLSLNSLNMTRSKSFDMTGKSTAILKKKISTRSIACGTHNPVTSNRSTDTSEYYKQHIKDIGVNTVKRKLVDAAVGNSSYLSDNKISACEDCSADVKHSPHTVPSQIKPEQTTSPSASRIPRPTTLAISNNLSSTMSDKRKFMRQQTYSKDTDRCTVLINDLPVSPKTTKANVDRVKSGNLESSVRISTDSNSDDGSEDENRPDVHNPAASDTALFQPIQNNTRQKAEPSREMKAALKVLNDSLQKSPMSSLPHSLKNANNIVQKEWFRISSVADANPLDVEDFLDCFEEISNQLLEYIVNMTDISGNTALHYALSHGNFDVVSILLDSKVCNINQANAAGYTCVMLVTLADVRSDTHREVVRRLFQLADVNLKAKQHGQTALMLAVSHGRMETVQLLLQCGADVNIQDDDGSTALMCAAEHGHIDMIKLLTAQPDCDLTITDSDGSTALNIAMEAGNLDIGVLLYAQEHFSRGSWPYATTRQKRAKSVTPTPTTTPTPLSHHGKNTPTRHQDHSF